MFGRELPAPLCDNGDDLSSFCSCGRLLPREIVSPIDIKFAADVILNGGLSLFSDIGLSSYVLALLDALCSFVC